MQKHDIVKKRIDYHGNVIDSRPDGIGSSKVITYSFEGWIFFPFIFYQQYIESAPDGVANENDFW